jgi:rhodanese-related sulfurtransferase
VFGTARLERVPARTSPCQVPQVLIDGHVQVEPSWGAVQPIEIAAGVRTVGELEVIEHLENGLPAIDTRQRHFHRNATIPGARRIPHDEVLGRVGELDPSIPTVFFCNGPQCTATPQTIHALLDAGYPAEAILYYRGGMHDWVTLGYPTRADHDSQT